MYKKNIKENNLLCKISNSKKYKFPFPTYMHAGLNKIHKKNNVLYQCKKSFVIFRNNKDQQIKLNKIFFSNKYTNLRSSNHIYSKNIGKKKISHYKIIADIIQNSIKFKPAKILEIGCYDGNLLLELSKRYKKSSFYGYDVSSSIEKLFKNKSKFNFTKNLNNLTQKFDLIICVNTFQYVPNPINLLKKIKKLISKNGRIFFLNIFLDKNPYSINYGDQYLYFTKNNFKNYLRMNGFDGKIITNNISFPRNLIGIFKSTNKKFKVLKSKKISFYIDYLKKIENKIKSINQDDVNIFGSTINAKFIFEILKKKNKNIKFIDEYPYKVNKRFLGKKIIHPSKLKKNSLILMPYGPTNDQIISKLDKKYRFKFLKL